MTDYKALKDHFRKETSKLDRWIYQGDIADYFDSLRLNATAVLTGFEMTGRCVLL